MIVYLQIYYQAPLPRLAEAITTTNRNQLRIKDWTTTFGLSVNPIKAQVIIVANSKLL